MSENDQENVNVEDNENEQEQVEENNENLDDENVENAENEEADNNDDNDYNERKMEAEEKNTENQDNEQELNDENVENNGDNNEEQEQRESPEEEFDVPVKDGHFSTKNLSHANVYEWADSFEFSIPKKNLTRDFSDGVNMVEMLVKITKPPIIFKHVVSRTLKKAQKIENWKEIQRCLHLKTVIKLSDSEIEGIVNLKPYVLEKFLERIFNYHGVGLSILKNQQVMSPNIKPQLYMKAIQSR